MYIDSSHRGPSLDISLSFKSENMATQQGAMDIRNMLNPTDEHVERKRQPSTASIESLYLYAKPEPVEVGGCYVQPYPTPENSPVPQYSITAPTSHGPQHGPLPSVSHLLYYPTPPPTLKAELPLRTLQHPPNSGETYHQQRSVEHRHRNYQDLERRPRSAGHNTHQSSSPRCRSRSHRSNRSERDYLYRVARTPPSTPSAAYLESTTKTLVLAQASVEKKRHHSNEAYRPEQVKWFRYHKIDLKWGWTAIKRGFEIMFPGERLEVTQGGLSSRLYRHDFLPRIDLEGNFVCGEDGKILLMPMKVRTKDIGECKGCPWTFVERHPWAALQHDWVRPEHKLEAAKIIAGIETREPSEYTLKQRYAVAIRKYEMIKEASRHSKRNGSLSGPSTSPFDDIIPDIPSPTREEIEEDERFEEQQRVEELHAEASQQKVTP